MAILTIAIPFYNAERFLNLAIESVISQSFPDWNLILIDDGSTDTSLSIAKKYEFADKRIKVLSDGKNKNLAIRLNEVAAIVNTKYLARMDADDIMHVDRLKKQVDILERFPSIDVLGTNSYSINEFSKVTGIRIGWIESAEIVSVKRFIHPTIMAKTLWFKENPYDPKAVRVEDIELWIRCNKKYNFMCISTPLFFYREFGDKYYKKYFKGIKSINYILKKHNFSISIIFFAIRYILSCIRSYLYYISNKEELMISKRNDIIFDSAEEIKNFNKI